MTSTLNSSSSSNGGVVGPAAAVPRSLSAGVCAQIPLLRQRALQLLAAPLAGDELAAEYLLMAALGSVSHARLCVVTISMHCYLSLLRFSLTQIG